MPAFAFLSTADDASLIHVRTDGRALYEIVPFVYEDGEPATLPNRLYPVEMTVAEWCEWQWRLKGLDFAGTMDWGGGADTIFGDLCQRTCTEEELMEPGALVADGAPTEIVAPGGTFSFTDTGSNPQVILTVDWCRHTTIRDMSSAIPARLYWSATEVLRPSIAVTLQIIYDDGGSEFNTTLTNYATGGPDTFIANADLAGITVALHHADGDTPTDATLDFTKALWYSHGGIYNTATGAVETGRSPLEPLLA